MFFQPEAVSLQLRAGLSIIRKAYREFVISYKKKLILWVKFDLTNRESNVIIYLLSDKES